ncbi:MAG: hypothetical protein OXE80_01505 [Gammaproteobacteria bacterium]|nr:hypothetical protein [Gammaproteobacteria bacterium]
MKLDEDPWHLMKVEQQYWKKAGNEGELRSKEDSRNVPPVLVWADQNALNLLANPKDGDNVWDSIVDLSTASLNGTYLVTLTKMLWGEDEDPADHVDEEVSEADLVHALWTQMHRY